MTVQAMRCKAEEVVSWMGQSLADAKVLQQRPERPEPMIPKTCNFAAGMPRSKGKVLTSH